MQTVEISAKTVQDATKQAADKLGVAADQLKVTVLEETKGLFGKSSVKVRAEVVESAPKATKAPAAAPEVTTPEPAAPAPAKAPAKPARGGRKAPAAVEAAPVVEPEPVAVAAAPAPAPEAAPAKADGRRSGRGKRSEAAPAKPAEKAAETDGAPEAEPAEEVQASQADAEALVSVVRELLEAAQLSITAEIGSISGRYVNVVLDGKDVAYLVGKHGEVLNALQYLVNIIAGRSFANGVRATLDGNNYRNRREQQLTAHAKRVADEVIKRGEEAVLEALPAFERRIVHKALSDYAGISTYSEGEEPNRRVVIAPGE